VTEQRHGYKKDPNREGMCTCGQGRSQDVHQALIWRRAPTGNWLSDTSREGVYRCREFNGKWIPEHGENPLWNSLSEPVAFNRAKEVCEEHRVSVRPLR